MTPVAAGRTYVTLTVAKIYMTPTAAGGQRLQQQQPVAVYVTPAETGDTYVTPTAAFATYVTPATAGDTYMEWCN